MLRVLTLSSLFPDATRPVFGPFVERQTLGLAAHPDVEVRVVAPIGIPPWPLSQHSHYGPVSSLPDEEVWKGLEIRRPRFKHLPGTGGRFDPAMMARALLPLLRDMRETFPFDVIDAQYFFPDGPAAILLGKALGVPVSIKARGSDLHYWGVRSGTRAMVVDAGRKASGLLAVSAALKADMVALGMPGDHIRVHYTGVDLSMFQIVDRAAAKARQGLAGPVMISIGTLNERKGHRLVIEALRQFPDATLMLIGQGPDRAALEGLARKMGVEQRVKFLGLRPHDALPGLLAAADVMVLASASEGLANVWVEALACGVPIVITNVGGAREVLDRPEAGRLIRRDVGAIGDAVADILANPPDRAATRQTAERFTWEANTAALHAHLAGLRGGR
jgi:teichuronic acid biosynthesis glycosyltransferase TuaC